MLIRQTALLAYMTAAFGAFASVTTNETTKVITFNVVSAGDTETYDFEITSDITGVEKTGAGTAVLTAKSASFTGGQVNIREGALQVNDKDALGSGNTVTVANGAQYRMIYNTAQNNTDGQNNDIVLQGGDGPDHTGAIYATAASGWSAGDYFLGNVRLEADSTIACGAARGFGRTLDLGGRVLTIKGPMRLAGTGAGTAGMVVTVKNPGKICIASGQPVVQGRPVFEGNGTIEMVGGSLQMWNVTVPVPWKLKVAEDATLNMGSGLVNGQRSTPAANVWQGDVEIASGRTLYLTGTEGKDGVSRHDFLTLAGIVSGEGGISIGKDAEFRLSGTGNTYSGGTTVGANTLKIFADGNISTNGAVSLSGGAVELHLDDGLITSEWLDGLLGNMSTGRGQLRFVASAGKEFELTSDFSAMHPSIGLYNYGGGTVVVSGKVQPGAMLNSQSEGRFVIDGDWIRTLWSFSCSSGIMDVKGGSLTREWDGERNFKVGSSNDVANARMRILAGGMLNFPVKAGGDTSQPINIEDLGTKPSILEIHEGAVVTGKLQVATGARSCGAVHQYGGDVFLTTRPANDETIGYHGRGYYWMNGGTLKTGSVNPYLVLGARTGGEGVMEIQGGSVSIGGGNSLLIGRGASHAELYLGGGTAEIRHIRIGGDLTYSSDRGADAGGQAVLTLSGTNSPSLASADEIRLSERTNEYTSVVNLNAGVLSAVKLYDVTLGVAGRRNCKSFVNFNGGTLRFNATRDPFGSGHPTRITVFEGGATIELTQSGDHLPSFSLLAPAGRGIKSVSLPAGAADAGYSMPPVVYISGGGGEAATAHVRFDPATGTIDRSIEVTSPGWGFMSAPTVTIKAPDMKTDVVCDVELADENEEDGGLTLRGSDGINANRNFVPSSTAVSYTYKGPTVVEAGVTLYPRIPGVPNPFSSSRELRMAGGAYSAWNSNPTWRRVGGHGRTRAWELYGYHVTEALFFRAEDLEQGLFLGHDCGWISLGENCVVEIDDFSKLTQRRYTLVKFLDNGKHQEKELRGAAPRLADDAPVGWRLRLSADRKTLRLVDNRDCTMLQIR